MLRNIVKWAAIGLALVLVAGAALFAFGLRVVVYGGGTPRLEFVESERTRSERIAEDREAHRAASPAPVDAQTAVRSSPRRVSPPV